jgi:hypothetical protein
MISPAFSQINYEMSARPGRRRLLSSRLRIVSPFYQAKNLGVCRERKGINPPFIRKDQIRALRHYCGFPPNWRRDKNQQPPGVPTTNLVANGQAAKHVSYPTTAANDNGSPSMSGALKNQPKRKRYPPASAQLKTEKAPPQRPQSRAQRPWQH